MVNSLSSLLMLLEMIHSLLSFVPKCTFCMKEPAQGQHMIVQQHCTIALLGMVLQLSTQVWPVVAGFRLCCMSVFLMPNVWH